MSRLTSVSLIALASISLTLAGCQKKAEGQVVAIVNGEEITLNELNNEISELTIPAGADKDKVRAQVLKRMVERRLLAQAAKDSGLDRDPAYVNEERRMKERLLVSMYAKKALDTVQVPDTAKVDQYIASHPSIFADRKRYRLQQLQFAMPADANELKKLDDAHSMAEVQSRLKAMGIDFKTGAGALDSAAVPPAMLDRIKALPAGEPFIVPNGDNVVVNVITATEPLVVSPEQARPIAAQAIRTDELEQIGQQRLEEAKAKAKIDYQKGYEPADDAAAGSSTLTGAANASTPAPAAAE